MVGISWFLRPLRLGTLVLVVTGRDFAVATSGVAECGPHIIDLHTGQPTIGLASGIGWIPWTATRRSRSPGAAPPGKTTGSGPISGGAR
jgi:hypothetical protein